MPAQGTALLYQLHPNRGDGGPHAVQNGVSPSSFGMEATTLGPSYGARSICLSQRRVELEFRERFYKCTQHDWKTNDFNGSIVPSGRNALLQPMLSSNAAAPNYWVPLSKRRPSNPYRLGRKIVASFTNMLFSHGRWPQMRSADPDTQDWAEALVTACSLTVEFIRARNAGGSCGVVGMSWGWVAGKPRVRLHEGKHLHCLKWKDEDEHIPEHVTELWIFQKTVINQRTGKPEAVNFFHRRDWTEMADVVFHDVEVPEGDEEPNWAAAVDAVNSYVHNHGRIHFEWISNVPADEADSEDGQPDYAETYEQQDTLDVLNSVVVRGAALNLDPTLKLKVEPELVNGGIVRKGSENALVVGETGDADYLELDGSSLTAGMSLVKEQCQQILDTCECVLTDPDKAAASGMSSVALKIVYAPMIAKCDVMRMTYGRAIERILNGLTDFVRCHLPEVDGQQTFVGTPEPDEGAAPPEEEIFFDDEGNPVNDNSAPEEPVEFYVNIPPREETIPVLGEDGLATGEQRIEVKARVPGKGQIALEWGEYFKPTADDIQKTTASLASTVAGRSIMSQRSAVELTANLFNRNPNEEWITVSKETADARAHELAANSGMWPATGEPVPGASDQSGWQQPPDAPDDGKLQEKDAQPVLTVNEVRQAAGHGPLLLQDGSLNPDGYLTVTEFDAKVAAKGTVEGESAAGMQPDGTITTSPFGGPAEVKPPPAPPSDGPSQPPAANQASTPPKPPPPSAALTNPKNQPKPPKV